MFISCIHQNEVQTLIRRSPPACCEIAARGNIHFLHVHATSEQVGCYKDTLLEGLWIEGI